VGGFFVLFLFGPFIAGPLDYLEIIDLGHPDNGFFVLNSAGWAALFVGAWLVAFTCSWVICVAHGAHVERKASRKSVSPSTSAAKEWQMPSNNPFD
jgi:hypothetical protein